MPGRILGIILEYLYLIVLLACFLLALGNRPQGSNKFYMFMIYFWIGIMLYLIFAVIYIAVRLVQAELRNDSFSFFVLFINQQFYSLTTPLLLTYVVWLVASLLFLDSWHMFTSVCVFLLFLIYS